MAYNNEADLAEAVLDVVPRMRGYIRNHGSGWRVQNPVNPEENFADKWTEEPRKAQLFFAWLGAIEREYKELLTDQGFATIGDYLREAFGKRDAEAVMAKQPDQKPLQVSVAAPAVLVPRKSEQPTTPKIELPSRPSKPWRP